MKAILQSVVFAAALFVLTAGDDKPCYNWDEVMTATKETCEKCKKDPATKKVDMCMYKEWSMTDEDGYVPLSKIRESYLYGLEESKKEVVLNAMKNCGKDQSDPLKDSKDVNIFWNCGEKEMIKVCPEYEEKAKAWANDPLLKSCFSQ